MSESLQQKIDRIKGELAQVPALPGVYIWKNHEGEVIYVGKAKQLRARMRQYVNFQDERAKIPLLVEQIDSFDYVVTENEHESLVLENNFIKQYSPFFNADFKDDKSYPFIAITKGDTFPAIKYTREKHRKDTKYFGPFTDSRAARSLVDIARRVVPICSCSCADWRRITRQLESNPLKAFLGTDIKPCFDAHVGLGPGACCGMVTPAEYAKNVKRIERFLDGNHQEFIDELQEEMFEAAADLDFERANRLKQRIETIQSISSKQHAVSSRNLCADVIGIYREETIAAVHMLVVRDGSIIYSNEFIMNKGANVPDEDLSHAFFLRYYDSTSTIPKELIVSSLPEDKEALEQWLTEKLAHKHGAKVKITVPQKGEKHDLLQMAQTNAKHALMRYKVRNNYDDKRINEALLQLESALALQKAPMRIESYDISTIHGSYTVASMVVFENGKPAKDQYRRFKIKQELEEANDFASMNEVLRRRFSDKNLQDERFAKRPDLVILDGGRPQLAVAIKLFEELGIEDIALCGLAKRDEELFVTWQDPDPVVLPSGSPSLYLVKQVRDEAHRFAISFHRELRGKGMTQSILDSVAGLGPVRKKALRKKFKSFTAMKQASLEELKAVKGIPVEVAEELYRVLRQYTKQEQDKHSVSEGGSDDD